ncbi:MAG TPA: ABC transporter permease [Deltaproteobacteria bacterium]|nr:ABC transporter permease [Deltaproteobacteria bacterium]
MHVKILKDLRRNRWFLTGLSLIGFFFALAMIGPFLAPFDPQDFSFNPLSPPAFKHLLGVNDGGQDIFSELLYSLRNTVLFGLLSGSAALVIGVLIGAFSGWFGGFPDAVLMRLADILLAIPAIMILIIVAAVFRPSPSVLALILAFMTWPTISKAIRAQTLGLKESLHVKAAVQMGGGNWHIIRRHLLPEMFPLYLIGFAAKTRMAMFMEASLAFLGLFDPGRKSLGMMISYALKYYYLDIWWNWLLPPILCLSFVIMAITFVAISLENVLDPRLKEGGPKEAVMEKTL